MKMKETPLQWGHDKIVMEVQLKIDASVTAALLQWGHDKIVMEVTGMARMKLWDIMASMGP